MDNYWHKYQTDEKFHNFVDLLLAYILQAEFTPSEIRAAAMVASIKFEQMNFQRTYILDKELEAGLHFIEEKMLEKKEYADEQPD